MNKINKNDIANSVTKLQQLKNAAGKPLVTRNFEQSQVSLIADNKISPAQFKKHSILLNTYLTHPLTLRALKKDIFVVGEDGFEDLTNIITCSCCNIQIDTQFWHFCPFCEAKF